MPFLDTIRVKAEKKVDEAKAKVGEKIGEAQEYVESLPDIIENKIERDLLLTQRKWVDKTVFWGNNVVNNFRLNRSEKIIGKTQGRIDGLDNDIEMARRGLDSELKILQRQKERAESRNRPTDLIDQRIADRQQINQKRIDALGSKRKGLLGVRGQQEGSKDSFERTKNSITEEMNEKINKDIALIENQFNFKGLKYRESILDEELVKMNADVTEIQKTRDEISADAAEMGYSGSELRRALKSLDIELKNAARDRDRVSKELFTIRKRIASVEDKKAGWENLRVALGVNKEEIPKDRAIEIELMKSRSEKEQLDYLNQKGFLQSFIEKQSPDSYSLDPAAFGEFFRNMRDNEGFDKLDPQVLRSMAGKLLLGKRKKEKEEKLLTFNEAEKVQSLGNEGEALWDYSFKEISETINDPDLILNFVASDIRDDILQAILNDPNSLRKTLSDVGYSFTDEQYVKHKKDFVRVLQEKAKERFAKIVKDFPKNKQNEFIKDTDHKALINDLVGENYVLSDAEINSFLDQYGFDKIRSGDVDGYLSENLKTSIEALDADGQLQILRSDKNLKKLLQKFGYNKRTRGKLDKMEPASFTAFHNFLKELGFNQLSNTPANPFQTIVNQYIARNP